MDEIGVITSLWRYPVKGLAAEPLTAAHVGPAGFAGDRGRALFVQTQEHGRYGKTYRGKENSRLHLCTTGAQATALGRELRVELRETGGGPYFDLGTVSVVLDSWIAQLEAICGRPLDPLRFRPNILIRAKAPAAWREADLIGWELRAGNITLRVSEPIVRCVTISYDLANGAPEPEVARTIVQERGNIMGVYCDVIEGGTLATGENVLGVAA